MKKLHLALATNDIGATVADYTVRLGFEPCLVIPGEYALWRNESFNISVRHDPTCSPGELRHLGWEDAQADTFTTSTDVNGILWEHFTAALQAEEIEAAWPGTGYIPDDAFLR